MRGILFNLKPNGDYLTVRFNGKEDNLVLWTFNKGVRKFVKRAPEEVPLKTKEWYAMKIAVQGHEAGGLPERQEAAGLYAAGAGVGKGRGLVEDRQRYGVRGLRGHAGGEVAAGDFRRSRRRPSRRRSCRSAP